MLDQPQASSLDAQSGYGTSRAGRPRASARPGHGWGATATGAEYNDAGGASRFFHVFDAEANLNGLDSRVIWCPKAPPAQRPVVDGVRHPTVKPLALMRTLLRLVTPPGGLALDLFAGSGTTGEAALLEELDAVLIERDPRYIALIERRLNRHHPRAA